MKITGIKGYIIKLPAVSADGKADCTDALETCLIELVTDSGLTGYGESPVDSVAPGLIARSGENIIGADPEDVQYIMDTLLPGADAGHDQAVNPKLRMDSVLSAVEFALWDIKGKSAGLPVGNILGGHYRKKVALADSIGRLALDDCVARVKSDIDCGIKTIKLRIGADDPADVTLLKELRERFGWELIIRLDAACAWNDVTEAARTLKRMEPYSIQYVQDALNRTDAESYRRLREVTGIPMAMGRTFATDGMTARQARVKLAELIRTAAIDVLAINPAEAGGLLSFTQLAAMCNGASINVVAGNARCSISQAIWATGCILCKSASYAHDILRVGLPEAAAIDISEKTITHEEGYIRPFEGPGFGFTPDWDAVNAHCVLTEQAGDIN